MYHSLSPLLIANENELRSVAHFKKLKRAKGISLYLLCGTFCILGCCSLALSPFFIFAIQSYLVAIIMLLMGTLFFWGSIQIYRELKIDPVINYLRAPLEYEFCKGTIHTSSYISSGKRANSKIVVEGQGLGPDGRSLLFFETFSPDAWPFINEHEEDNLTPDDDWYELKGKRQKLPLEVYVVYHKQSHIAALAGIDQRLIDKNV